MVYGKRANWDAIRELAFGGISGAYAAVGGVTTKAARAVKITNNTDQTVYVTTDNTEDQLKLPRNSFQLWDITSSKALADLPQFLKIGTQFYCKDAGVATTSGWVSVELLITESGL